MRDGATEGRGRRMSDLSTARQRLEQLEEVVSERSRRLRDDLGEARRSPEFAAREQQIQAELRRLAERAAQLKTIAESLDERERSRGAEEGKSPPEPVARAEASPPLDPPAAEPPREETFQADPAATFEDDPPVDGSPTVHELEIRVQAAAERLDEWRYYLELLRAQADEHGVLPAHFRLLIDDVFADGRLDY